MEEKTLIIKVVTKSEIKTMQIISAMTGQEVYILGEGMEKEYIDERGPWEHIKKKGK